MGAITRTLKVTLLIVVSMQLAVAVAIMATSVRLWRTAVYWEDAIPQYMAGTVCGQGQPLRDCLTEYDATVLDTGRLNGIYVQSPLGKPELLYNKGGDLYPRLSVGEKVQITVWRGRQVLVTGPGGQTMLTQYSPSVTAASDRIGAAILLALGCGMFLMGAFGGKRLLKAREITRVAIKAKGAAGATPNKAMLALVGNLVFPGIGTLVLGSRRTAVIQIVATTFGAVLIWSGREGLIIGAGITVPTAIWALLPSIRALRGRRTDRPTSPRHD